MVCFLHIPKTSGSSVNLYLESRFRPAEVCPARSGHDFAALGAATLARFRMFRAECDASVIDLLPAATPVVTLLRSPLDRAVSQWRYIQRLPEHRLHEQFQDRHASFDHLVDTMPSNAVARLLAAAPGDSPTGMGKQPDIWDDDELLDRATARLETFAVVGITERHDESVALIAHHFGWAPPGRLPRTNAAPSGDVADVAPAAQAAFDDRNRVDVELYARAVAMFERRLSVAPAVVRAATYERRLATVSSSLTRRKVVDMCGPVPGAGWLPVIETTSGSMRPIGVGGEAWVDLPVRIGRFTKLEATCPAATSEDALAALEITVDDVPISFGYSVEPLGVTLRAALAPTVPGRSFTRIAFRTTQGELVPPNHTGAVSDLEASLAFSRLELIPYAPERLRRGTTSASAEAPTRRAALFFHRRSPAWSIDDELQRRLDDLGLWGNVEALQRDGFTVVPDVIGPDVVEQARASVTRLAVASTHRTRRRDVMQPLVIDPLFVDLLLLPAQLALADVACGKGLLDSQVGLVRDRTSNPQGLHAENALWMPAPYPEHNYLCSAMLTLDDFDEANGGTCFVPGSHLSRSDPPADDSLALRGAVTPEVAAGSLIVWVGGTWHGATQRMNDGERVSVLTIFTRPSLRPAQDIRAIPDALLSSEEMAVRLRRLDPFEQDGWYDGDPDAMLHWIRNTPRTGSVTCEWGETITESDRVLSARAVAR